MSLHDRPTSPRSAAASGATSGAASRAASGAASNAASSAASSAAPSPATGAAADASVAFAAAGSLESLVVPEFAEPPASLATIAAPPATSEAAAAPGNSAASGGSPATSTTEASAAPGDGDTVRWVECPRDAWQSLPRVIPTERKRDHLRDLIAAGFRALDMGSFVSHAAVPQMADTDTVLASLPPDLPAPIELRAIVGNARGLERAIASRRHAADGIGRGVDAIGYPLSVDDAFQQRNLGRTIEASWEPLEAMIGDAHAEGIRTVVYLSMAFGNPDDAPWHPDDTARMLDRVRALDAGGIVLADTVGRADAETVAAVLDACERPGALGLHLHARPDGWEPLLDAALERGVRTFEGAFSGLGGCPFAGDELVGNLPTERVLPWLADRGLRVEAACGTPGAGPDLDLQGLEPLRDDAAAIGARYRREQVPPP